MSRVATPLHVEAWCRELANYPDGRLTRYLLRGFTQGFRIGFTHDAQLKTSKRNMHSASEHPAVIRDYIHSERAAGRIVGPVQGPQSVLVHTSPIGVIPKKHSTSKWRLIVDLSSPTSCSVNDGIDRPLCSLQYAGVDEAISIVQRLGRGCILAKLDLKNTYRIVPVHPDDRHVLGLSWEHQVFLEAALPFGLRSAPKIFSAVADALLWIMSQHGVRTAIHYLDDFLFAGPPASTECHMALSTARRTCDTLGVPIAPEKVEVNYGS